jgi:hypothetical protein
VPRGPSGAAPPPPDWLAGAALPIDSIPAGQALHRIHRRAHHPVFFGPVVGRPATFRFDSASGRFGVLYLGLDLGAALAETLLRNPARLMVAMADIEDRAASVLTAARPLRLVRLHGSGLQRVGTDNAVSTGPYAPCGAWSDALHDHAGAPDGIAYRSRHDPDAICVALFERAGTALSVAGTTPLPAMLGAVAAVLDRYGKSVTKCYPGQSRVAPEPRALIAIA